MSEWTTLEIDPSGILAPVNQVIDLVDDLLSVVIALLQVADLILSVVKTFLVGLLDPIRAAIEALLQLLQDLINDLKQLGVYVVGDWTLAKWNNNFADLIGGYDAYERRMISRLVDTSDPNRPNFSANSAALGLFCYASSGDLGVILKIIAAIQKFFGGSLGSGSNPFPAPTTPQASFGQEDMGAAAFGTIFDIDGVPDSVAVTWSMPSGTGTNPNLLGLSPSGFIIEVSTVPDGMLLLGEYPKADTSAKVALLPKIQKLAMDPVTNRPLRFYGGLPMTDIDSGLSSTNDMAPKVFFKIDQNTPPIPPSELIFGDSYLIGTSFYLKAGLLPQLLPGQTFTAVLKKSDLPLHATFVQSGDALTVEIAPNTQQYYVRVRAVTSEFDDAFSAADGSAGYLIGEPTPMAKVGSVRPYNFPVAVVTALPTGTFIPNPPANVTAHSIGPASGPCPVLFPTEINAVYQNTVVAAFAAAILARFDLKTGASATVFENNRVHLSQNMDAVIKGVFEKYNFDSKLFASGTSASWFRTSLSEILRQIAVDLQTKGSPPPEVQQLVIDQGAPLLSFKWKDAGWDALGDMGIQDALDSSDESVGIGPNPWARGQPVRYVTDLYDAGFGPDRLPCFYVLGGTDTLTPWLKGQGSADMSPVVYDTQEAQFVANVLTTHASGEVLTAARKVLQIASVTRPAQDSEWIAFRLIPQALIPLEGILDKIDQFIRGLLAGTQGIIDQIIAVIEAIQARIHQLQALLEKIRSLLAALRLFKLPSMSAVAVVGNGTAGLLSGFLTATNKPQDGPDAYGGGALIVAGGMPGILMSLIQLAFGLE